MFRLNENQTYLPSFPNLNKFLHYYTINNIQEMNCHHQYIYFKKQFSRLFTFLDAVLKLMKFCSVRDLGAERLQDEACYCKYISAKFLIYFTVFFYSLGDNNIK